MSDPKSPPVEAAHGITIETLAAAFAAFAKGSQPSAALLTGMSDHRLEVAQGKHEKPVRYRIVQGKSQATGSTFDQHVVESRTHKTGRVVRIENYRYSPETYLSVADGGTLPSDPKAIWIDEKSAGLPINNETPRRLFNAFFRHSLATIWHGDLRAIVGQPLRPENCIAGAKALDTPWEQSRVHEDRAAE